MTGGVGHKPDNWKPSISFTYSTVNPGRDNERRSINIHIGAGHIALADGTLVEPMQMSVDAPDDLADLRRQLNRAEEWLNDCPTRRCRCTCDCECGC